MNNQRNGQHHAERGERVHASPVDFRNVHSVNYVVQKGYQLRDNGRYGKPKHQRQDFSVFEKFGSIRVFFGTVKHRLDYNITVAQ